MRKAEQALKQLEKIRKLIAQKKSPFHGMTEEEVIMKLRKTREELWEKKFATHP